MKLWGGRFNKPTDRTVEEFTASLPFDQRLFRQDIAGSIAHCRMLGKQGIISSADADRIVAGLNEVLGEIETGSFVFDVANEDIHMAIEGRLSEKIGDVAGRLHTARSRNDQVALDARLFTKTASLSTVEQIVALQRALLDLAERGFGIAFPGYTHLQRGQPVLFSHHLLAYVEMLDRDVERFQQCCDRADVMPLGAGALAGVPYPIDPVYVAKQLGFSQVFRNSIDAVSDRDFVLDYLSAASIAMMHLSRLSEEFVLWSASEFAFVELDDAYATGSSIMPQKKNPDVAELVRGKTGRVYGHLLALLTTMKGLPLAYDKDMQEDKEGLFDSVDTLVPALSTMAGMVRTATINKSAMAAAVENSFALATDVADYLVSKSLPFRAAHEVAGKIVRWCVDNQRTMASLTLVDYQHFSPLFASDVLNVSVQSSLDARRSPGGTAPERVRVALDDAKIRVEKTAQCLRNG